jgi:hypothetical protein
MNIRCSKCGDKKDSALFSRMGDGYQAWCKPCAKAYRDAYNSDPEAKARAKKALREWRARPENAHKAKQYGLKYNYGLDHATFLAMMADQGGLCAICGQAMERPHVDHDHSTGKIRQLLCHGCNCGIGQMGDDLERVEKAAQYLRRWRS